MKKQAKKKGDLETFGARVKELRKKAGYTSQEIFAYDHGFGRVQINQWERGADIKLSSMIKLAKALNVTVSELVKGM